MVTGLTHDDEGWHDDDAIWSWGNWKISSNSYTFKLREIVDFIVVSCGGLEEDDHLVAEWPMYFDSARGNASAKDGHTINLAGINCYIAGFFRLPWRSIHFITAAAWKGSISKEITRMRFFKALGVKQIYTVNHNAVDAVMILLQHCKSRRVTSRIVKYATENLPNYRG